MKMNGTGFLALFVLVLLPFLLEPALPGEFISKAKTLINNENWFELEKLSRSRLDEDSGCFQALICLSFALAGQGEFDDAVAQLVVLNKAGFPPDRSIRDIGVPMDKIINIIYMTCWANFDADYNRKAWSALFDAFQDSASVVFPASRLLTAALLKEDKLEIARMESWFEALLKNNEDNSAHVLNISQNYARGYLMANQCSKRTFELAETAFLLAWEDAEKRNKNLKDPLEKRERCDVATNSQYWDVAHACFLRRIFEAPDNRLSEREPEPGAVFEDITQEVGFKGISARRVAAADYDQDGFTDLCFSGRLFKNLKGKKFENVTKEAGITRTGNGSLFFDFDNDGFLDILVTAEPHPFLFRNKGLPNKCSFEDVTQSAGLDRLTIESPPEGAAVMDIDGDGWLDFYMAAYEKPFSVSHPDLLARNNGNGTFSNISAESGILTVSPACGLGATCSDFDQDGDTDLYVSNYRLLPNFVFQNDGSGKFTHIGKETGLQGFEQKGWYGHTIGSCFGDIDNDGDMDLFCANLAHPRHITQGFSNLSMLYVNGGLEAAFSFKEERRARGIRYQETHSDPALKDYDNDGDLDLYITATYKGAPSVFYQNDGKGFFEPVTFRSRAVVFEGWGQAWFDMDNDGDLDHVIGSGSGVILHRNKGNENHWVKVKLQGKKHNLFGVGARVRVTTPEGLSLTRELRVGRGTQSQDGFILYFGLGADASTVKVEVTWPTGFVDTVKGKVDRTIEVKQKKHWKKKPKRQRRSDLNWQFCLLLTLLGNSRDPEG